MLNENGQMLCLGQYILQFAAGNGWRTQSARPTREGRKRMANKWRMKQIRQKNQRKRWALSTCHW